MAIELSARLPATDVWLQAFHDGDRATLARVYHEHFATVEAAVGRVVSGADQETVIHEVFFKLIASSDERRRFLGGSLGAWLTTVARNHAIDHARRRSRERTMPSEVLVNCAGTTDAGGEAAQARVLLEKFRDGLPEPWRRVFDLCCLGQLPQRDAAAGLGIARTTLAYQDHQIRIRLRRFLVSRKEPP
jgi:RNA polymerase sigma-70 factor (ECF subfamily)